MEKIKYKKENVLYTLDKIEEKYRVLPEEAREYGNCYVFYSDEFPGKFYEVRWVIDEIKSNNPNLLKDLDIVIKTVKTSPNSYRILDEENELIQNMNVVKEACKINTSERTDICDLEEVFIRLKDDIKRDENKIIELLKVNPDIYYVLDEDMKHNPKIIMEQVKSAGYIGANISKNINPQLMKELKPYITYKIEGMRVEPYEVIKCDKNNNDFEYYTDYTDKHIICCSRGNEKFEIELYKTYGEDYDNYSIASWGHMKINKVEEFQYITDIPNKDLTFELQMEKEYSESRKYDNDGSFKCDVFAVNFMGCVGRYEPFGDVSVDMRYFDEIEYGYDDEEYTPEEIEEGIEVKESDVTEVMKEIIESEKDIEQQSKSKENNSEKQIEEKEVNTIDIEQLGLKIGMEAKEQTLPNGKQVKSLVWDKENLIKAVNAVKHLSEEGKPVIITGAAPAWLVSALTHTVHPCPVSVYMPQIGKNVDIPKLAHGEANKEGEVAFKTTEKGDSVLIEYNMDLPEGITTYDENNLSKVIVPEVSQGKAVYLSGRGPNYLTVAIAEAYAHTNSSVSLYQPGVGYTCSITHSRNKKLGDLDKDPLGQEQVIE